MDSEKFHNVDPASLQGISIADIQAGNIFPDQKLDYAIPVPTQHQSIPQGGKNSWLAIEFGADPALLPPQESNDRGRFGGC